MESFGVEPRIATRRAVMQLFLRETGANKTEALETYMGRYAPHFDEVYMGHEKDAPEDLLRALCKKVDTIH